MKLEFFVPIIILGICFILNIIEVWVGIRGPSEYLQTHFILKNKILVKLVIIKPTKDPRIGNKRKKISLFHFVPYMISLLLIVISCVITLIYGIAKTARIGDLLSSKITFIVLLAYLSLNIINAGVLTTVDYILQNKELKQKEKESKK